MQLELLLELLLEGNEINRALAIISPFHQHPTNSTKYRSTSL